MQRPRREGRGRASPFVTAASAVVQISLSLSPSLPRLLSLHEHNRGGGGGVGLRRSRSSQVVDVGAVRSRPLLRRKRRERRPPPKEFVARPPPKWATREEAEEGEEVNIWLLVAKTRASRARRRYTKARTRTHAMKTEER